MKHDALDLEAADLLANYVPTHAVDLADETPFPLEPDFAGKAPPIEKMEDTFIQLLYKMPEPGRIRVLLDALKSPVFGRVRKELMRELARITGRPEKELLALSEVERGRLFARKVAKISIRVTSAVLACPLAERYLPAARRLLKQLDVEAEKALAVFQTARAEVPDSLWDIVLRAADRTVAMSPRQRAAEMLVLDELENTAKRVPMPFSVNDLQCLTPLEKHLLELHATDPARAKPLIASLAQISPNRPENFFLFALTEFQGAPPGDVVALAWHLAGKLYRWGDNPNTVDGTFAPAELLPNADAIRAIFSLPQLATARNLVGEYLLRQLTQAGAFTLLVEVLPPEMFREHERVFSDYVRLAAGGLARGKQLDELKRLAARFPFLKSTSFLATGLRRSGQFEAALAELRNAKEEEPGERALSEARIADAFELELPEEPAQQAEMQARLKPLHDAFADGPEPEYCSALYALLRGDRGLAEMALELLEELPQFTPRIRAYSLLAALQSQNTGAINEMLDQLDLGKAEEVLAGIPANLLRAGLRSLAIIPQPGDARGLTELLYQHLPEALDPLLGNEDLLAANPALLRRLADKTDESPDPLQRWAGYQKVMDLATGLKDQDLVARAIDGCLAIKEPLLVTYQTRLLQQQIAQCEDPDLREVLVDKLTNLHPEESKPFLYQLLHTYLGNQRHLDAWRIVETLAELGENSTDLAQCRKVLQPSCQPALNPRNESRDAKLPRPVSVGFYGGDTSEKARTDQIRAELMRKHPGLSVEFDHGVWNVKNLPTLLNSVTRFDVIVASNLMRTDISRGLRQRARELDKIYGFCRNHGTGTITKSIMDAVSLHLARPK